MCPRRQAEQPEFQWLPQRRAVGDWVVARMPGARRIDSGSVRADRGAAVNLADDPRPANFRNVPPQGGGN
jgi:hypothetical protein